VSPQLQWGDLVVDGEDRRRKIRERRRNGVDGVEVCEHGRQLLVYFLEHTPRGLEHGNIRIEGPPGARAVRATHVRRATHEDRELEDRLVVDLDRPGTAGAYRLRVVERMPDGRPGWAPYRDMDPRYAQARFVFDIDAPLPAIASGPPGAPAVDDGISYLGRDFAGLTQLMLSRMAVTIPDWAERHEPDIWIALVELLAYVGDDLSYYEDAVATEAYLQTARMRVSVKRHARLVDYRVHDGCAARTWVCLEVSSPLTLPTDQVRFAAVGASLDGASPVIDAADPLLASCQQYSALPDPASPEKADVHLRPAHTAIKLWSWGESDSHLVTGATQAVLVDGELASGESQQRAAGARHKRTLRLRVGDVLILEETADPATAGLGPADPTHRQAVRLTEVRSLYDELYEQPLVEIRWAGADALRFDLGVKAAGRDCAQASGNVVLVAHGREVKEPLDLSNPTLSQPGLSFSTPFPDPGAVAVQQAHRLRGMYGAWREELERWRVQAEQGRPLAAEQLAALRAQFGSDELDAVGLEDRADEDPVQQALGLGELLARGGRMLAERTRRADVLARLAQASGPLQAPLLHELDEDWGRELADALHPDHPGTWGPAATSLAQDPRAALPFLQLTQGAGIDARTWSPALDLVGVAPSERAVVADVDDQGIATLRISCPPDPGAAVTATYRVGNGSTGNAVAEAVNAVVWVGSPSGPGAPAGSASVLLGAIKSVRNPLAVSGGIDPQDSATAKLAIPGSFLDGQRRALSAADYAAVAAAVPGVGRAAAELRFTGSQTVVEVAVGPSLGDDPSAELLAAVRRTLEEARRIGHLVTVSGPSYRPLVIEMEVSLAHTAIRRVIAATLATTLSSGWLADGTPAVFNPANLGFGQSVYSSPVIAAVQALAGVESVTLTRFGFAGEPAPTSGTAVAESLPIGALELPRMDNDPTKPSHGYALIALEGGR